MAKSGWKHRAPRLRGEGRRPRMPGLGACGSVNAVMLRPGHPNEAKATGTEQPVQAGDAGGKGWKEPKWFSPTQPLPRQAPAAWGGKTKQWERKARAQRAKGSWHGQRLPVVLAPSFWAHRSLERILMFLQLEKLCPVWGKWQRARCGWPEEVLWGRKEASSVCPCGRGAGMPCCVGSCWT